MNNTQSGSGTTADIRSRPTRDMKFEVIIIPVSDVERAKAFYNALGWRLDADFAGGDAFRVIQFTPPGSSSSIQFGKGITPAAPGSARGMYLVVSDIEATRAAGTAEGPRAGASMLCFVRLVQRSGRQ